MSDTNDALLHEIRENYDLDTAEWADIRAEGDIDMRYISGDPWDPADRKAREDANRPCLSLDEIGQYENQVINDILANPRAMKFAPTGNGANDKGAEFYANKAREVEYRSHAQLAYTTAFQNCVERGYGWIRQTAKYETDRSFNQDLWIEEVVDPNAVLPGPAKRPDHSDMDRLFYLETWSVRDFKRKFKGAKVTDFSPETCIQAPAWFKDQARVLVAEYWTKEVARKRRLLLLKPQPRGPQVPVEVFEDELPQGFQLSDDLVLRERPVDDFKVTQYLTNGLEILETNKWKGKHIPFASCLGKVIYIDGKRVILSMTRLARDPFMLYCYYRTCQAELVGMTPKIPYFVRKGSLDPTQLLNLQRSLHEPMAVIEVENFNEQGQPFDWPTRNPYDPRIDILEMGAEGARRAIQAAIMGSPLPTAAQRHNEKSGVALQEMQKTAQIGNYHFSAHYDDMIRQNAVIFEDNCDKILDAARNTGVREADGKAKIVRINDPKPTAQQFPDAARFQQAMQAWQKRLPDGEEDAYATKGDYIVTVSSGPAADSQREAVSDFIGKLAGVPEVMAKAADLIIRLQGQTMNLGPLIDELADRLTPPEFKKPKDGEGPDPQQMQQQLSQAGQMVEQLKAMVQKLTQEITTKKADTDSRERIAQMDNDTKKQIADIESQRRAETAIAVAEISSKAKDAALFYEERARIGVQSAEADSQMHDQAHDVALSALEHQQALEASQQAHDQALEQADAGVTGQMAVQEQAAALAPQPEAGA